MGIYVLPTPPHPSPTHTCISAPVDSVHVHKKLQNPTGPTTNSSPQYTHRFHVLYSLPNAKLGTPK